MADPFLLCPRPFPTLGRTSPLLKCPGPGVNTPGWQFRQVPASQSVTRGLHFLICRMETQKKHLTGGEGLDYARGQEAH